MAKPTKKTLAVADRKAAIEASIQEQTQTFLQNTDAIGRLVLDSARFQALLAEKTAAGMKLVDSIGALQAELAKLGEVAK